MTDERAERHERWWLPAVPPAIWGLYFTVTYITAALWCGRFATGDPASVEQVIGVYTAVALAAIAAMFVRGFRRRGFRLPDRPHAADTPEDRRHFVAFTTMLLAGLSLIATLLVALSVWLVEGCA
jgi:hypothetical protein